MFTNTFLEATGKQLTTPAFVWKQHHNRSAYKAIILQSARHLQRQPHNRRGNDDSEHIVCFHYNGHDVPRKVGGD